MYRDVWGRGCIGMCGEGDVWGRGCIGMCEEGDV